MQSTSLAKELTLLHGLLSDPNEKVVLGATLELNVQVINAVYSPRENSAFFTSIEEMLRGNDLDQKNAASALVSRILEIRNSKRQQEERSSKILSN